MLYKKCLQNAWWNYGFESSKDITMSKYNAICDEIEGLKMNSLGV